MEISSRAPAGIALKITLWILLFILFLSACAGTSQPNTSNYSVEDVYTAVAWTLTTQAQASTFTTTATQWPSPTPVWTATSLPATITPTTSYYYYTYTTDNDCEESEFVSDVTIPDGTVLSPGQTFVKIWKFYNSGPCTWGKYYSLEFVDGYGLNGSATLLKRSVAPGETVKVSVEMVAPYRAGTYIGYWQLVDQNGIPFGEYVYVRIVVAASTATSTPTLTATPTATTVIEPTVTSTPAPTEVPTETSNPTETPTETATPPPL